jgi:hypothetical protein
MKWNPINLPPDFLSHLSQPHRRSETEPVRSEIIAALIANGVDFIVDEATGDIIEAARGHLYIDGQHRWEVIAKIDTPRGNRRHRKL